MSPRAEGVITAGEIASVCARYELGTVQEVRQFQRGSRRSGKALLKSSTGVYLLKRRAAAGGDSGVDPRRVALSHQVQLHLQSAGFPVPPLVGTRTENNSMLQIGSRVYEVFRFIPGGAYDGSATATAEAGRVLAWYHRAMLHFIPGWDPPTAGYHGSVDLPARLRAAARRLSASTEERNAARTLAVCYETAAGETRRLHVSTMPRQIIHGDWHPGNLLFTPSGQVAAVVDHDAVGLAPRALDIAYGALHFSLPRARFQTPPEGVFTLADNLDETRLALFCRGYHQEAGGAGGLTAAEKAALAWLMAEAMVAEAAAMWASRRGHGRPEGRGGGDGSSAVDPAALLSMAAGKAAWLTDNAQRLATLI